MTGDDVDIRALRDSLAIEDPRERTAAVLGALAWDRSAAHVEWAPHTREVGRFTVGDFPTSASVVDSSASAWRPAWHAGFRWCISAQAGALHWFDLKKRLHWSGAGAALNKRTLAGLTPSGFESTAQLAPLEVTPEPAPEILAQDPTRLVADRIRRWWNVYCEHHIKTAPAAEEAALHKETFTRFMAGVLLLRTIEDTERIDWLPKGTLRENVRGTSATHFRMVVSKATTRLNSRVISKIADVSFEVARTIVRESYEIGVNFAALDVDPVGTFYEEILGVEYIYTPTRQRELFGNNVDTATDRNARRAEGVYYTPRIYADTLARSLVRPRVRAAERIEELPVVADIAAGSGELLCAALREILAEPMWCKPDVAWQVLDTKMQAMDKNPLALQLCALNLLRTAVRFVPELFDGRRLLPRLEDNLRVGNALVQRDLDALPAPDVVIINPPFHAPNRWRRPDLATAIPALAEVAAYPHQAVAFFAAAVHLAPKGAGLGVVMPSTIFTGTLSAPWRGWLAEHVRLDLVVANYGTPFRDVDSYAGLVVGRRRSSNQWRTKTRVVHIGGLIDAEDRDTGALLSESSRVAAWVQNRVVPSITESSPDWLGRPPRKLRASRGKAPLREVVGDTFHQGIEVAPRPWGQDLFIFRKLSDGRLENALTRERLAPLVSPRLRPFSNAKKVSPRVPLWCEPIIRDHYIFAPDLSSHEWFSVDSIAREDPGGARLGEYICNHIVRHPGKGAFAEEYAERARHRELRFRVLNGFLERPGTLIRASKASPTTVGQGRGHAWRTWVNLDGKDVPLSGFQLRTSRPEIAAALVAWMSIDEFIESLMTSGQAKKFGSMQFTLHEVAEWLVPDLRDDRLQTRLDELYAAFLAYRVDASVCTPHEARGLDSYREAQRIAVALWSEA